MRNSHALGGRQRALTSCQFFYSTVLVLICTTCVSAVEPLPREAQRCQRRLPASGILNSDVTSQEVLPHERYQIFRSCPLFQQRIAGISRDSLFSGSTDSRYGLVGQTPRRIRPLVARSYNTLRQTDGLPRLCRVVRSTVRIIRILRTIGELQGRDSSDSVPSEPLDDRLRETERQSIRESDGCRTGWQNETEPSNREALRTDATGKFCPASSFVGVNNAQAVGCAFSIGERLNHGRGAFQSLALKRDSLLGREGSSRPSFFFWTT